MQFIFIILPFYRALKEGCSKQIRLHNKDLRVMVADSWNQPDSLAYKLSDKKLSIEYTQEYSQEYFKNAPIHMLNDDCLIHIFKFLLIADRVRIERGKSFNKYNGFLHTGRDKKRCSS